MTENRSSISSVMISDENISDCFERGPSDMEEGRTSSSIKGILRTSYETPEERDARHFHIAKLCAVIITIIICAPIILFDLIYAYTDKSCVDIYPNKLDINMKTYLLVCGYLGIANLIIVISVVLFSFNKDQTINTIIYTISVFVELLIKIFIQIWNIIGAIIFWGTLYHSNDCSKTTYNYLFVTIIIKLVLIRLNFKYKNNKKK